MGLECKYVNVAGTGYEGIMLFLAEILCCAGKKVLISDCTVEHSMEGYFPCVKGLDPKNTAVDYGGIGYTVMNPKENNIRSLEDMKVEDDVGIVPVDIGPDSVELGPDALDDGILEPQRCEMAVSDPAAVADGLGDCERLVGIDPVLPGKAHRMVIQIIGGLKSLISVYQHQKSCGAACPHAETVGRFEVCGELHSA